MILRDHEYMHGGLGIDVPKGENALILIDLVGRYLAVNDFAEYAIHNNLRSAARTAA